MIIKIQESSENTYTRRSPIARFLTSLPKSDNDAGSVETNNEWVFGDVVPSYPCGLLAEASIGMEDFVTLRLDDWYRVDREVTLKSGETESLLLSRNGP